MDKREKGALVPNKQECGQKETSKSRGKVAQKDPDGKSVINKNPVQDTALTKGSGEKKDKLETVKPSPVAMPHKSDDEILKEKQKIKQKMKGKETLAEDVLTLPSKSKKQALDPEPSIPQPEAPSVHPHSQQEAQKTKVPAPQQKTQALEHRTTRTHGPSPSVLKDLLNPDSELLKTGASAQALPMLQVRHTY